MKMGISVEIREFAEIMTNRMREHDEILGTNNYVDSMSIEKAVEELEKALQLIEDLLYDKRLVVAKTKCVDLANLAMILWKKL